MIREHENEPIKGLPGYLPEGEDILWQGAPDWRSLARRMFNLRWIALYFAVLVVWRGLIGIEEGAAVGAIALGVLGLFALGLGAVAILASLAWLIARSTVYTVTNKRVVFRFGVALPITINLPFKVVESADLKVNADGTGNIALRLNDKQRISYLHLWPNARPWRMGRTEPMLRSIPNAEAVAAQLAGALLRVHPEAAATPRVVKATSRSEADAVSDHGHASLAGAD